jgi:hypothetical protein
MNISELNGDFVLFMMLPSLAFVFCVLFWLASRVLLFILLTMKAMLQGRS